MEFSIDFFVESVIDDKQMLTLSTKTRIFFLLSLFRIIN